MPESTQTNPGPRSLLIYSVHKTASMFIHRFCIDLSGHFGVPHYSINYEDQAGEINSGSWADTISSKDHPCIVGPIRSGEREPTVPEDLSPYNVVLVLRDPRDMLTSLFYSFAYSHYWSPTGFNASEEQRKAWADGGVDAFVLDWADRFLVRYKRMVDQLLGRPNVLLLSYEQLVTDYAGWLKKFMSATAGLPLPVTPTPLGFSRPPLFTRTRIRRILQEKFAHEFIPHGEDIRVHRRQITPGDHRRKLKPETIAELDGTFGDVMRALDYPVGPSTGPGSAGQGEAACPP